VIVINFRAFWLSVFRPFRVPSFGFCPTPISQSQSQPKYLLSRDKRQEMERPERWREGDWEPDPVSQTDRRRRRRRRRRTRGKVMLMLAFKQACSRILLIVKIDNECARHRRTHTYRHTHRDTVSTWQTHSWDKCIHISHTYVWRLSGGRRRHSLMLILMLMCMSMPMLLLLLLLRLLLLLLLSLSDASKYGPSMPLAAGRWIRQKAQTPWLLGCWLNVRTWA